MGISCKSWGKMKSIEEKLMYREKMDSIKKAKEKQKEQAEKKAPKEGRLRRNKS